MSTPGVSHPSPTTAEDFRRVLDERAVQPVFQPVAELDWACPAAPFTGAVRGGLGPPLTLFINAEPVSLGVAYPDDLKEAIELGSAHLRVVVEATEWAVAGDPARLLATVAQAREAGWGVTLDAFEPNVLLACFQEADQLTETTRSRYEYLATRAAFTGALGHGMPVSPVAGVRGVEPLLRRLVPER